MFIKAILNKIDNKITKLFKRFCFLMYYRYSVCFYS